jgi:hypothetical protein|tara:strand:- start:635 stop:883 length:249 start_codon:yes stop_codon:yes gene_type:complete
MRLVAGSSPASRTIDIKQGEKVSYHGQPPPEYNEIGIGVVNPLHQIELKLKKVQDVLDNISDQSILTANDLKCKLEKVLKER